MTKKHTRKQALTRRQILAGPPVACAMALSTLNERAHAASWRNPVGFVLHEDGSFDVHCGPLSLKSAYPALNDEPLRPLSINVQHGAGGSQAIYKLSQGQLRLSLGQEGERIWIDLQLEGFAAAPHWVFPLAGARVQGATRFFRQGFGFGGPSGVFPIAKAGNTHSPNRLVETAWSYDSFLTTALVAPTGDSLLAGALAHHDYLQRCTIYNRSHRRELVDKRSAWDEVFFEAGFATENLPLDQKPLKLPRLYVMGGNDLTSTLAAFAQSLAQANNVKMKAPPRFHWDSWYEFYEGHDAARLNDTLEGLAKVLPPVPFQGVLIDAGFSSAGDWLQADERLYPGGLHATFKRITESGHAPGVWISPFMVSSNSQVYKQHPEWMVHGLDGKPVLHGKGKPLFFIYASHEERYYLDTSHPGAFAFLRDVFRTYKKWGVKSYKLDFMEWGWKDSTTIKRHTPGKTSIQHFVDVLKMIKAEIGSDAYFHGCITPFAPMIGFADGMRVAYDVDDNPWTADGNTQNMFNETVATQYMNNVLWQNDPDVFYVRDGAGTTRLNDDQVYSLALWNGILGGVVSTSDRPHRLTPDRLALLRFVQPGKRFAKARFPLWAKAETSQPSPFAGLVAVRDYPDHGAHGVLVLNPNATPLQVDLPLADLNLAKTAAVFIWGPATAKAQGKLKRLSAQLAPHQAVLYWVSRNNAPPPRRVGLCGEAIDGLA